MQTFSDSASLSSQAILRLDEMRELLINLSQTTNAKAYTRLATTICTGVQESITALQSKLISPPQSTNETQNGATQPAYNGTTATETDTTTSGVAPIEIPTTPPSESTQTDNNPTTISTQSTLENRLIAKMIELYTIIYDKLANAEANQFIVLQMLQSIPTSNDIESLASKNDLTTLATSSQLSLVEQMLQTIISTLSTQSGTTSGGLSDLQDSKLTNINNKTMETNEIAHILYQQVGIDSETYTTVHAKLSSLESKTDAIIATLNITPPEPITPTPFEPSPNVVYKTRDTITSEFSYTINTPTSIHPEFFTINDGVSAMCKVEFDISCDTALTDVNIQLMLSENTTLYNNSIEISASINNHYCITGIFITDRTDYSLQLIFNTSTNTTFTVSNIQYEVVGNNANFLYYERKWDIYNINYNYYLFNKTNGIKYLVTNAITPDLGQDYTNISTDNSYLYFPFLVSGVVSGSSTLKVWRYFRLNKSTCFTELLNESGNYITYSDSSSTTKNYALFRCLTGNGQGAVNSVFRYNSKTNSLALYYLSSDYNKMLYTNTTQLPSNISLFDITPVRMMYSYKNLKYAYPLYILGNRNGNNYLQYNTNNALTYNLGYGTRVSAGSIPNYQGKDATTSLIITCRVFLYVYDHWEVVYCKVTNSTFTFLGRKTLQGNYTEILPGFNGDYFVVQDGQLIRMSDPDVVPEPIVI